MVKDRAAHTGRRNLLLAGALLAALPKPAAARTSRDPDNLSDKLRIADLVQRERSARDAGNWNEMAACWHPNGSVEVSWYSGDAAGFIAATRRNAATGRVSVHQLAPTIVEVRKHRAIAETPCQLVSFVPVNDIEMCMTGFVRLLWRAEVLDGHWLIAGLRMIYIRDYLVPCNPSETPVINSRDLLAYRPAYRYLSYILARSPHAPRDDLPGIDRPETVDAVRASQTRWLSQG